MIRRPGCELATHTKPNGHWRGGLGLGPRASWLACVVGDERTGRHCRSCSGAKRGMGRHVCVCMPTHLTSQRTIHTYLSSHGRQNRGGFQLALAWVLAGLRSGWTGADICPCFSARDWCARSAAQHPVVVMLFGRRPALRFVGQIPRACKQRQSTRYHCSKHKMRRWGATTGYRQPRGTWRP